jgi:putative acetyltransferase
VLIRTETSNDCDRITEIHIAAFRSHPFSKQTEHLIVQHLRKAGALTLSLVAEIDGVVLGHVAFSPVTIGGIDWGWFALGPIGVDPETQGQGIGSSLVKTGLKRLRELGAQGCVLVGDPGYYERFGFRHESEITMGGVPPRNVLCIAFSSTIPVGEVKHHPAFWVE